MKALAKISERISRKTRGIDSSTYEVVRVNTDEERDAAHRLRYQVYCLENSYESPERFGGGLEYDEYDTHADQCLLVNKRTRKPIGTVRLILPSPDHPEYSFPIQNICRHSMLRDKRLLVSGVAEISRFAISKSVRDEVKNDGCSEFRRMSQLSLHLIKAIILMCWENDIHDLFAVMEPSLLRLLARFSIYFSPIGPMVDYHGMRQPCHASLSQLLNRTKAEQPAVWSFITNDGLWADVVEDRRASL